MAIEWQALKLKAVEKLGDLTCGVFTWYYRQSLELGLSLGNDMSLDNLGQHCILLGYPVTARSSGRCSFRLDYTVIIFSPATFILGWPSSKAELAPRQSRETILSCAAVLSAEIHEVGCELFRPAAP